jgi:hypothetical protein
MVSYPNSISISGNRMAYTNEVQVFEYSEIEFGLVLSFSCLFKRTSSLGF